MDTPFQTSPTPPEHSLEIRRNDSPKLQSPPPFKKVRAGLARRVLAALTTAVGITMATATIGCRATQPQTINASTVPADAPPDAIEAQHADAIPYAEFQKRLEARWKDPYYIYGCPSDRQYHWALPQHPPDKGCYVKAVCEHTFDLNQASKKEKHDANCIAIPDPDYILNPTTKTKSSD